MNKMHRRVSGVTLIEVLLVTVVISAVLYMAMGYLEQKATQTRVEKSAAQIQQILNAALAYYAANGKWPANFPCLQGGHGGDCQVSYLPYPIVSAISPGQDFYLRSVPTSSRFELYTAVVAPAPKTYAYANAIAGLIPTAILMNEWGTVNGCTESSNTCFVLASVPVPGQNTNNATGVNFASLYHNGACVPVPSCPVAADETPMTPSIMVVPASVTGAYDAPTGSGCNPENLGNCTISAYPINSFTASATGPSAETDVGPPGCASGVNEPCYESVDASGNPQDPLPAGSYWRVCLSIVTEKGTVNPSGGSATGQAWGQLAGDVMAITKCNITNDTNNGSGFTVWSQ